MNEPVDDAQRDLEQRALRNVRALVDKYEDRDAHEQKSVRNIAVAIAVGILVLAAVLYAAFRLRANEEPATTVILPPPANVAR